MASKIPVHVEVILRRGSPNGIATSTSESGGDKLTSTDMKEAIVRYLSTTCPVFKNGTLQIIPDSTSMNNLNFVESICICDLEENQTVSFWQANVCVHLVALEDSLPEKDFIDGIDGEEGTTTAYEQWELPNRHLSGLWESIVLDNVIKNNLLGYCSTSMLFSDAFIDPNIISWNRMVLLYGPPGTGKTTLCKALAHKLFIRCSHGKYQSGILMEINSHSLFSKWFSESGKLVMKLFDQISEIAEDEECLVVVLIDEVESIASARSASARSNEPGDAVRVVNAVLTSLDALKRKPNVFVLCTSNMVSGIDEAFRDRVDYSVYIGPPSPAARYQIMRTCLEELVEKGIIECPVYSGEHLERKCGLKRTLNESKQDDLLHCKLQKVAKLTEVNKLF